ncbi:NAD-glutamate dehydrogenase [Tomitella fengzijianii]|uniref:NAD-glutamate dehydrogenase n=1 Tax=Tomitella fengzijianii TaxID=2597660 RepID=A0A516X4Y4_9ACTN|nr:NAD-glutamate dehydrogenase [Tomitella fengzijianii]QDQ98073.1 NAD-glutamate dehydrogenase [Tomitella fengzijianii]
MGFGGSGADPAGGGVPDEVVEALTARYRLTHAGIGVPGRLDSEMARHHVRLGLTRTAGEALVSLRLLPFAGAGPDTRSDPVAAATADAAAGDGDQRSGESATPGTGGAADSPAQHPAAAVLQVVTDDAPFLVESLIALLGSSGIAVDHIVHPILRVRRDGEGRLVAIEGDATSREDCDGEGRPREQLHAPGDAGGRVESWIHLELSGLPPELRRDVEHRVRALLADIGWVVEDTTAMHDIMRTVADDVERGRGVGTADEATARECAELLRWMSSGHLALLGYRRYAVDSAVDPGQAGTAVQTAVADSGLGVFHSGEFTDARLRVVTGSDAAAPDGSATARLLTLTQGQSSTVAMHVLHPFYVGVRAYDDGGRLRGEHRFLGVFTMSAMHQSVFDIPVLGRRARSVLDRSGYAEDSFNGQSIVEIIESYPRTEMFATSTAQLLHVVDAVLDLGVRRGVRLFLRGDRNGRFISALVYLPRDRYTTTTRLGMRDVLLDELGGTDADYSARITESALAMVHYTIQAPAAWDEPEAGGDGLDLSGRRVLEIQERLAELTRSWDDALMEKSGETAAGRALVRRYARAFPDSYKEDFTADDAAQDIDVLQSLEPGAIQAAWRRDPRRRAGQWRLMIYLARKGISLSRIVPVLQSLGVDVIFERPYPLVRPDGVRCWVYSFGITLVEDLKSRSDITPEGEVGRRFLEAFEAVWNQQAESDRFDELVMRAGVGWREAAVLRAYGRYLRQARFSYSLEHIQNVLCDNPEVVRSLVELFRARFTPGPDGESDDDAGAPGQADDADSARRARADEISAAVSGELDRILSIDTDRVLRAFLHLITGTVRTNFYMLDGEGAPRAALSFKLAAQEIPELPRPRPMYEVYVYSPRVAGVHLRYGAVARGGLRWSDRREDFRTEVLGLVKAQAVKNAVIVPLGAKGGFVVKRPPAATGDVQADRDALRAEGVACYKTFIRGLLDVTDNLDTATGRAVPPRRVVRHDGDDTYLVVAADKGTASFSDIANGVAADYGYWLGDAFASGGSSGYDHKEMGITARGAWESVRRHFRERGVDTQTQDITAVGVGDMSGDVFGNGMLCSEHIRLVAAFDHRHVFVDPNPSAAAGFAERQRLYALPRSSWADYDTSLISAGGGVWPRTAKSVPVSPQMRAALGLADDVDALSAPELVRAVLLAPADLLWNGGIGTYVKARTESDADVGDKANDAVRVDGADLRVRVVGEGGNLGVTQHGRIEYARRGGPDGAGGAINTDAIDNSAGVDSSDHEVNIKILLQHAIAAGRLREADRDALLASMTDDVAAMVLADNVSQNRVLGVDRRQATAMLRVYERMVDWLEAHAGMDRAIEGLPGPDEFDRREEAGEGLTSPELSVLLAYVKLAMKRELLAGSLPDSGVLARRLPEYFPAVLRERFARDIDDHPLRREIIATVVANDVVDRAGITFMFRLGELAGAGVGDAVRAFITVESVFGLERLWERIDEAGIGVRTADHLTLVTRRLVDRASRWLLANRPQPLQVAAEIRRFQTHIAALTPLVPQVVGGAARDRYEARTAELTQAGVPPDLAREVAGQLDRFALLDICTTAEVLECDAREVTRLYFALAERLRMDDFQVAVSELERGDRWHALARLTLREDLYSAMRMLTEDVLRGGEPGEDPPTMIREWESGNTSRIGRARMMLAEIAEHGRPDLASLSVAARQFRSMVGVSTVRPDPPRRSGTSDG